MTSRRALLMAGFVILAMPRGLRAQERPSGKVFRIGCMPGGPLAPRVHQWDAFRQGLRELGYVEGQNVVLEFRMPAREGAPYDGLAADLARLKVDVFVVSTPPAVRAARRAASAIPIVMTGIGDPVKSGLVSSLARPDGNVTGLSQLSTELSAKRLELLREAVPTIVRVAVLWDPSVGHNLAQLQIVQSAARSLGIDVLSLEAKTEDEVEKVLQRMTGGRAEGLIVANAGLFYGLRARIMAVALERRFPAIWAYPSFSEMGAFMVYGPSDTESYRRAAGYVDRILRGAKPADLPIEQPTQISLIVNLRTAKALGLTVSRSFLLRADRVIE